MPIILGSIRANIHRLERETFRLHAMGILPGRVHDISRELNELCEALSLSSERYDVSMHPAIKAIHVLLRDAQAQAKHGTTPAGSTDCPHTYRPAHFLIK